MKRLKINFSRNWNNKLLCDFFTTIRLYNPNFYKKGNSFDITLNDAPMGIAEIVEVKMIKLSQLNEWVAALDTGESLEYTRNLLFTMYKNKVKEELEETGDIRLSYVLLKKEKV